MHKSKPVMILKAFTSQDMKEFDKFVASPFYNKNDILVKLFGILKKEHPDYEGTGVDREKIYYKLFNSKEFDESKLRYAFSDLSKLLEKYIIVKELEKNRVKENLLLLDFYKANDIEKYFNQTFDETRKSLESSTKDSDYYFNKYLAEEILFNYSSVKRDKSLDDVLQQVADNLDSYYLSKKLKFYCEMYTRQNFLNSNYQTKFLKEILDHIEATGYEDFPAIIVYYYVLKTLIDESNESNYYKLLELLDKNEKFFSREEMGDLYVLAQNYCTKQINQGNKENVYLREYFKLTNKLIDKEMIYENGYIIPSVFKNIVTVGLRLEEYDWTENFIYAYKDKLAPKYKENAFTYNLAWLHFFRGEYKKTLRLLSNVEYMDVYYVLDSKILLLKTYFELDDADAFYSLIDSFYVYLRRNELIAAYQKNICLNFVKFAKRLMRIKQGDSKAAEKLIDEINETKQVASISWLLKKAEQYIK
jgi:hypothetical protein